MALSDVIKEARTHFIDGVIEDGEVYVFQCPDGIAIIALEDGNLKFQGIAGAKVNTLESRMEIAHEGDDDEGAVHEVPDPEI